MARLLTMLVVILLWPLAAGAQSPNLNEHVEAYLKSKGIAVVGVSLGDYANKATWKVNPPTMQAAAQPHIDAFNANDPALLAADADATTDRLIDALADDLLTAILENFSTIAAEADAGTLKNNIGTWKQRLRNRVKTIRRAQ